MIEGTWPPDVGQTLMTDFKDVANAKIQEMIEHKKKLKVQSYLEKFVRSYLHWMKEPQHLGFFHAFIDQELIEMERREACFFKTIPEHGTYLFKRVFCYEGLGIWKRCPLFRCDIAFPCWEDCPYVKNDSNLEYERETPEERYLECSEEVIQQGLHDRKNN